MPNDLPMSGWAGMPYVVASAHPSVLDAVAQVTLSLAGDGVARVMERHFPGGWRVSSR
ncbi:HAD family hydrolase [Streptomyces sp. NPDC101455]|uniref:HAD family hydrolase n=1 Tax=Streptomyces sp. NPDC101455 TaxID=3366142 RepID=UPI00380987FB